MSQELPKHLKIEDLYPMYWVQVNKLYRKSKKCKFFDISKGKEDPPFKYLVIGPDDVDGFYDHLLVCYFDEEGNWITQTPFKTVEEAFDHGEFAFNVNPRWWKKCGPLPHHIKKID